MVKHTQVICLQLQRNFSVYLNKNILRTSFWWDNVLYSSFCILLERINVLLHFLLSEIYSKIEYRNYKIKGRSYLGILIKKYSGIKTLLLNIFVVSIMRYWRSLSLNILCIYIFSIFEYKIKSQYSASVTKSCSWIW